MVGRETVSVSTDHQVGPLAFDHWLCTGNLWPAPTARQKSVHVKPDCLGANLSRVQSYKPLSNIPGRHVRNQVPRNRVHTSGCAGQETPRESPLGLRPAVHINFLQKEISAPLLPFLKCPFTKTEQFDLVPHPHLSTKAEGNSPTHAGT